LDYFPYPLSCFIFKGCHIIFCTLSNITYGIGLAVIVSAVIFFDGESIWMEGLSLVGLYCLITAAFRWGRVFDISNLFFYVMGIQGGDFSKLFFPGSMLPATDKIFIF